MHAIAQTPLEAVQTPLDSLHWKMTLGEKSLAAPGTRTQVSIASGFSVRHSATPTKLSLPHLQQNNPKDAATGYSYGKKRRNVTAHMDCVVVATGKTLPLLVGREEM